MSIINFIMSSECTSSENDESYELVAKDYDGNKVKSNIN